MDLSDHILQMPILDRVHIYIVCVTCIDFSRKSNSKSNVLGIKGLLIGKAGSKLKTFLLLGASIPDLIVNGFVGFMNNFFKTVDTHRDIYLYKYMHLYIEVRILL